jgi:hypothetical protein
MQGNAVVSDRRRFVAPAIAAAFLILALGLLMSGPGSSNAATDGETQGVSADILSSIEWNPTSCNTAVTMPAQSFSVAAGSSQTSVVPSVGCVSSNSTWDVSAAMTTPPTSGLNTIPASAFRIQSLDTAAVTGLLETALSVTAVQAGTLVANGQACTGTTCTLETSRLIVDDATSNTLSTPVGGVSLLGGLFAWNYTLNAPSDQAAGNYTGGQVTLTASN